MKKALTSVIIVVVLAVLAVFIIWGIRGLMVAPAVELDRLYGEDTLLYAQLDDIERARRNLESTDIWKAVRASEFSGGPGQLMESMMDKESRRKFAKIKKFTDFFNGGVAFGVSDLDPAAEKVHFLFAGNVGPDRKAFESYLENELRPWIESKAGAVEEDRFKGITTYSFEVPDMKEFKKMSYAVADDYFFFGYPLKAVESGILHLNGEGGETLADNALYRQSRKDLEYRNGPLAFVNIEKLIDIMKAYMRREEAQTFAKAQPYLEVVGIDCLKSLGYCSYIEDGVFYDKLFLRVDFEQKGLLPLMMGVEPADIGESAEFIPADMPISSVMALGDLGEGWDRMLEELKNGLSPQEWRQLDGGLNFVEQGMGFNVKDDLWGAVGSEIGFGYNMPAGLTGMTSNPMAALSALDELEMLLVLQVEDEEILNNTIQRVVALAGRGMVTTKTRTYKDYDLNYFDPGGGNLPFTPAYAFVDGYMLLVMDDGTLESAIDAYEDEMSVVETPEWEKAKDLIGGDENGVSISSTEMNGDMMAGTIKAMPDYEAYKKKLGFDPAAEIEKIFSGLPPALSANINKEDGTFTVLKSPYPIMMSAAGGGMMGALIGGMGGSCGVGGPGAAGPASAPSDTVTQMSSLVTALTVYKSANGRYPSDLSALGEGVRITDGWGNELIYEVESDGGGYSLISTGADGARGEFVGGKTTDPSADIIVSDGVFIQSPEGVPVH